MSFNVIEPGFLTTIQDTGRYGYQCFGVPVSGAMDVLALIAGNSLVGNPSNFAGLEFTLSGPRLEVLHDSLIALTGCGFALYLDDSLLPSWTALRVNRGSVITIEKQGFGSWGYLCVSGGVQVPLMLNSRSTYLRGRFGGLDGRALQAGDQLVSPNVDERVFHLASSSIQPFYRPHYEENPVLSVVPGPQYDMFTDQGRATFLSEHYSLTMTSDRMGYRLEGMAIEHISAADIVSDGMFAGAVQVPANGQPIVMMAEAATTGGYTKIAGLTTVSRSLLAQCQPGESQVTFNLTTPELALQEYRAALQALTQPITTDEDDLLYYSSF